MYETSRVKFGAPARQRPFTCTDLLVGARRRRHPITRTGRLVGAFLTCTLFPAFVTTAHSQSFSLGADVVSRYVWRGTDFGESMSIQPAFAFSAGGFEIATWASYSVAPEGAGANEHDIWMGYTFETGSGSLSVGVTDYYFPAPGGTRFFNFENGGNGSHWIEPYLSYSGPESFPLTFFGGAFVHNDPDHSIYLEAGYPVAVDGVDLRFTLGVVANESAFYGTGGFAIINTGLTVSRELALTEQSTLPVSISYILNPNLERSFLVFGLGISL